MAKFSDSRRQFPDSRDCESAGSPSISTMAEVRNPSPSPRRKKHQLLGPIAAADVAVPLRTQDAAVRHQHDAVDRRFGLVMRFEGEHRRGTQRVWSLEADFHRAAQFDQRAMVEHRGTRERNAVDAHFVDRSQYVRFPVAT